MFQMRRSLIILSLIACCAVFASCDSSHPSFVLSGIHTGWEKHGYVYCPYISYSITNNGDIALKSVTLNFTFKAGGSTSEMTSPFPEIIEDLGVGETRGPFRMEASSISSQQYNDLRHSLNTSPTTVEVRASMWPEDGAPSNDFHYTTVDVPVPLPSY